VIRLAKSHLDIGLFTTDISSHHEFWSGPVDLELDHELNFNQEITQHRYDAHGSVIKVNQHKGVLTNVPPSGFSQLTIAKDISDPLMLKHPGGDSVELVPHGTRGVVGIGITISTTNINALMDFYLEVMGFDYIDDTTVRCGDTILFFTEGQAGSHVDSFIGANFRYLTVQIFDADEECKLVAAKGGNIVQLPITIGEIARYGFVTDPDGNWIEISARASLTGIVPKPD